MSSTILQKRRVEKGLSQADLANAAGISINSIKAYEHKMRKIEDANIKTLLSISSVLDVAFYELFDDLVLSNLCADNVASIVKV